MSATDPQAWTRLPTVADVRKRIRERFDDAGAVAEDVIAVWNAGGCGGGVERGRVDAQVAALEGEGEQLFDLRSHSRSLMAPDENSQADAEFNEVFYADQVRDRSIEVVDGGRAFVVGGIRVDAEDAGRTKSEMWSLRSQLRLAMAHIEFLREVKTALELAKARLEKSLKEIKARQDRALRRIADILLVIEEAALREEVEIDLGKMLGSVIAELREEEEEIGEIVTKFARKSEKVSIVLERSTEIDESSKIFLCNVCGKSFTLANSFSAHLSDHAGRRRRKRLICRACGKGFSDAAALASHRSAAHRAEKEGTIRLNSLILERELKYFLYTQFEYTNIVPLEILIPTKKFHRNGFFPDSRVQNMRPEVCRGGKATEA